MKKPLQSSGGISSEEKNLLMSQSDNNFSERVAQPKPPVHNMANVWLKTLKSKQGAAPVTSNVAVTGVKKPYNYYVASS